MICSNGDGAVYFTPQNPQESKILEENFKFRLKKGAAPRAHLAHKVDAYGNPTKEVYLVVHSEDKQPEPEAIEPTAEVGGVG